MIRFILLDIEGTTTDIDFVHKVLFPYAAERLANYVEMHRNDPEVQAALASVKETVQQEEGQTIDDAEAIDTLLCWICDDRKHTALKTLQGLIWKSGFENGDYQGHVYPDVPEALERWKQEGIGLGIYSSGSMQAQQLLFGHSVAGDLTPYFSHYFDTKVGGKKEAQSYRTIAEQLQISPQEILFLSDVVEELDAAAEAGFQVTQLVRSTQTTPGTQYPTVENFTQIDPNALTVLHANP
jgi:enolase-phosphatase E1